MKYIKKPYIVYAWQYNNDMKEAPEFVQKLIEEKKVTKEEKTGYYGINMPLGFQFVKAGDYIVHEATGEVKILSTNKFRKFYFAVPDDTEDITLSFKSESNIELSAQEHKRQVKEAEKLNKN